MMKKLILYIALLLLIVSCQSDEAGCLKGEIVNYNCCLGTTTISLNVNFPGAKTIKKGDRTFQNTIIVPGYVDEDGSEIFLQIRKYNHEKDSHRLDGLCLCAVYEGDMPTYTITSLSNSECPQ